MKSALTARLAERLSELRASKGWTLDKLAVQSGVSRAALSRLENAEVSPSVDVLSKLATAHDMSLSRMMALAEDGFAAHILRDEQAVIRNGDAGFTKRVASPGASSLAGEVFDCKLTPGAEVTEGIPQVVGQEHHLVIQSGYLHMELDGRQYTLGPGDSLRYRQHGPVKFITAKGQGAKFLLFTVTP